MSRRLPLYLTRRRNGLYMLSHKPPIVAEVGTSGERDLCGALGDAVGMRNVCPWFTQAVLGIGELEFGEPARVWIAGGVTGKG